MSLTNAILKAVNNRVLISKVINPKRTILVRMSTSTLASKSDETDFPVNASIISKLSTSFNPKFLDVINESHMHNVPKNSETHFKVVVVSEKFEDVLSLVKRHRMINSVLAEELEGPVHALSIVAKSPKQWEKMVQTANGEENVTISPSPSCRGGDGSLPKRR